MNRNLLLSLGSIGVAFGLYTIIGAASTTKITSYHEKLNLQSGGPAGGLTGAPGEGNCTSCHGGAVLDGNNGMNSIVLDGGAENFIPGETIPVTVSLTDGSSKNGFQVVVLDQNEEMAGSFTITDATNTQPRTNAGGQRSYVTHTNSGNSLSSWDFDWEVPLGLEEATFYLATNKTNANSATSGDQIYLSSHSFTVENASLDNNTTFENSLDIAYLKESNRLKMDFSFENTAELSLNIVDLNGRSVHYERFNTLAPGQYSENVNIQTPLENGIYVASFFVGNQPVSKKFMVQ